MVSIVKKGAIEIAMKKKVTFIEKLKEKNYGRQLLGYMEQSLREDEQGIYLAFVESIAKKHNLSNPEDMMMLDLAIYDFIRIKRLHGLLMEDGDLIKKTWIDKDGNEQSTSRNNPASYLVNAVEQQFRSNMKELQLTVREKRKKTLGVDAKDFSSFCQDVIDVEEINED